MTGPARWVTDGACMHARCHAHAAAAYTAFTFSVTSWRAGFRKAMNKAEVLLELRTTLS